MLLTMDNAGLKKASSQHCSFAHRSPELPSLTVLVASHACGEGGPHVACCEAKFVTVTGKAASTALCRGRARFDEHHHLECFIRSSLCRFEVHLLPLIVPAW